MARYIVTLRDMADLRPIEDKREEVIGELKALCDKDNEIAQNVLSRPQFRNIEVIAVFWVNNTILIESEDVMAVQRLSTEPIVKEISLERTYTQDFEDGPFDIEELAQIDVTTDDTTGDSMWGVHNVRAPETWDEFNVRGEGVRVAVLDTGVYLHPWGVQQRLFTLNPADQYYPGGWMRFNLNGSRQIAPPDDSMSTTSLSVSHGTHVSGTIIADNQSGYHTGVAPQADLMGVLCLPGGSGTDAAITAAIQWCIDPYRMNLTPTGYPAHIANMSFGALGSYSTAMSSAIKSMRAAGILPVVSSGNSGPGTHGSPANAYDSLPVGATEKGNHVTSWSSGRFIERRQFAVPGAHWPLLWNYPRISGPGLGIVSLSKGDHPLARASGTSMAAPHVAGVAALIKSAKPDITVNELELALRNAGRWRDTHRGSPRIDTRIGDGIVDAYTAVRSVLS